MSTQIKTLEDILDRNDKIPEGPWHLRIIQGAECLSYIAWNETSKEAILVDPKDEDIEAYRKIAAELKGYLWLAVIDTHTHADHISAAYVMSRELKAPYLMHHLSPSSRVHLRIAGDMLFPAHSTKIQLIQTPGHTQDGVTVFWGPFIFTGDTIIFGDTGRDDLPGGNAADHFESLEKIKKVAQPAMLVLPGHDSKGGRISSWATQLKVNSSLTQNREDFIREASAFEAPAPAQFKKSLRENFK